MLSLSGRPAVVRWADNMQPRSTISLPSPLCRRRIISCNAKSWFLSPADQETGTKADVFPSFSSPAEEETKEEASIDDDKEEVEVAPPRRRSKSISYPTNSPSIQLVYELQAKVAEAKAEIKMEKSARRLAEEEAKKYQRQLTETRAILERETDAANQVAMEASIALAKYKEMEKNLSKSIAAEKASSRVNSPPPGKQSSPPPAWGWGKAEVMKAIDPAEVEELRSQLQEAEQKLLMEQSQAKVQWSELQSTKDRLEAAEAELTRRKESVREEESPSFFSSPASSMKVSSSSSSLNASSSSDVTAQVEEQKALIAKLRFAVDKAEARAEAAVITASDLRAQMAEMSERFAQRLSAAAWATSEPPESKEEFEARFFLAPVERKKPKKP